jgi:hypothetical protein
MDLATFAESYHQQVLARCSYAANGQMREEAFTDELLEDLTEASEISEAETCFFRSPGRRGIPATKLNAFCFSGDGSNLDLFVCCYRGIGEVQSVPPSEVSEHFGLLRGFLKRALDGFYSQLEEASEAFEVARRIYEQKENLTTVRLFLLTDGLANLKKGTNYKIEPLGNLELRPSLWDIEKLHQFHESGRQREEITLDFAKDLGGPVPCLGIADATGEYWTFLAFFPGSLLARIYGDYGPRLLERNVRSFLQVRGNVNKGIQQTIADVPHRFLAYNNGISVTAMELEVDDRGDGHFRLCKARDFQIVNGGQTTASIFHAFRKNEADISKVLVQVKITLIASKEMTSKFVPLISLYANSQNKVNTADFSANGPYHQKLEEHSRTIWAPASGGLERSTRWYYERARGSYLDEKARAGTPAQVKQWEREHPLSQKFTKTDLAKFENTWLGLPHFVSRGAEKNFASWTAAREDSAWPVVDESYFHRLVAKAILFRRTEQIVSAQDSPGYRANVVTYALSWLVRRSGGCIDLDKIWKNQGLSEALVRAIDTTAHASREHITSPPGGRNITEWCKKEDCWLKFSDSELTLADDWEDELIDDPLREDKMEGDVLSLRWEAVRQHFANDSRPVGEVAARFRIKWPIARWEHPIRSYASLTWADFQTKRAFGLGKQRLLLQILESEHSSPI